MIVNVLVEGLLDEAVARRIIEHSGHEFGVAYGKKGWTYIEQRVASFDRSVTDQALLTLFDLMDTGYQCAAEVVASWLPTPRRNSLLRVVVREIESWILADRDAAAQFLNVALQKLPHNPEELADPKQALINIARTSRSKAIREALVPGKGMSSSEGPLYSSELGRFIADTWSPNAAAEFSPSLAKCMLRLKNLNSRHA